MTRTFELSQNGQQLYETMHIDAANPNRAVMFNTFLTSPPKPQRDRPILTSQ